MLDPDLDSLCLWTAPVGLEPGGSQQKKRFGGTRPSTELCCCSMPQTRPHKICDMAASRLRKGLQS